MKDNGIVVINYYFNDTLDLTPQESRKPLYNIISAWTGFFYHDVIGGSMDMQTHAKWSETIDLKK